MKKKVFGVISIFAVVFLATTLFLKYKNEKINNILHLTEEQKIEDYEILCQLLDECYPFWTEVKEAGVDKQTIYSAYRENIINTDSDIEYFKELSYFLREFKGFGHLSLLDGHMYSMYTDTLAASEEKVGEVEKRELAPLVDILYNPVSMNTYNLLDSSHIGFRSMIGLKEEYRKEKKENIDQEQVYITTKIIEDGKTAYIQIPSFELTKYDSDKDVLETFWGQIKETSDLIIDIRGNGGGSDLYWKELLVEPNAKTSLLSERIFFFQDSEITTSYIKVNTGSIASVNTSEDSVVKKYQDLFTSYTVDTTEIIPALNPFKGNIWLLVDEGVYSASENFVVFCKNTGFATIVGEGTGGDGGMADPMLFSLPNSGLIFRFSVFYGVNTDGTGNEANGTEPDIVTQPEEDSLEICLKEIGNKIQFGGIYEFYKYIYT